MPGLESPGYERAPASVAPNFSLRDETLYYKVTAMSLQTEAEENLRVIRSLMEKATIYRAISAPSALVGGVLAVIAGALLVGPLRDAAGHPPVFFATWLGALAVAAVMNAFFLRRDAARRGDPFVSAGMRMALTALAPTHVTAAVATVIAALCANGFLIAGLYLILPGIWCVLHGLGLLATGHFAPRSIVRLGWCFLAVGLGITGCILANPRGLFFAGDPSRTANAVMAITFGGFHIIYAALTWPRGAARTGGAS